MSVLVLGCVPPGSGGSSTADLNRQWVSSTERLNDALVELLGNIGLEPPPGQAFLPWFQRQLPRLSAATDELSSAYRRWQEVTDEVLATGIQIRDPSGRQTLEPAHIRAFGTAVGALIAGYEQQHDLGEACVSVASGDADVFARCFMSVLAEHGETWHRNGVRVMEAMVPLLGDPQAARPTTLG